MNDVLVSRLLEGLNQEQLAAVTLPVQPAQGALRVKAGSPQDLADAIERLSSDATLASNMGAKAAGLADELRWSRNLSPFLDALEDPGSFRYKGLRPGILDAVR